MRIDPNRIGAEHIDRIVEVSWPTQAGHTGFNGTMRGALTRVEHAKTGTVLGIQIGTKTYDVTLDGNSGVTIED